jgi:parvulin-like peptidyl-prolyl isomerase
MEFLSQSGIACSLIATFSLWASAGLVFAGISTQESVPSEMPPGPKVLAVVGEFEVTEAAAGRWLEDSLPQFRASDQPSNALQADSIHPSLLNVAVEHLISRRIVFEYLRANNLQLGADEIRLEIAALEKNLAEIGRELDDFLKEQNLSRSELEYELAWQRIWGKYLSQVLTDVYLEKHFQRHRREFDNSEMRVAHLRLKIASDEMQFKTIEQANQILNEIQTASKSAKGASKKEGTTADKSLDRAWNEAVKKYSDAPSAGEAGELGWIRFHEPMPKSFSSAAFALAPGEISPPVVTPYGVHLIRCLELKEGKIGWRDALTTVREHAEKFLFEKIAREHRAHISVQYR